MPPPSAALTPAPLIRHHIPSPSPPSITVVLAQDSTYHLTATASILSSPCVSSLTLTGQASGQAFILSDAAKEATIIAVPSSGDYNFRYNFTSASPACPGDTGLGHFSNPDPWGY